MRSWKGSNGFGRVKHVVSWWEVDWLTRSCPLTLFTLSDTDRAVRESSILHGFHPPRGLMYEYERYIVNRPYTIELEVCLDKESSPCSRNDDGLVLSQTCIIMFTCLWPKTENRKETISRPPLLKSIGSLWPKSKSPQSLPKRIHAWMPISNMGKGTFSAPPSCLIRDPNTLTWVDTFHRRNKSPST